MSAWPEYDVPYPVEDLFGTYTEVIVSGAADGAAPLDGHCCMIVAEDEWTEDNSVRTIRRISAISRS